MTNTFLTEAKEIISEFVSETRESLHWAKVELLRQYHLSILKEIGETYPDVAQYTETATAIIDKTFDVPDFVEAPERTNSIIVWDSGFSDAQWSVGVVIVKEGNSYRVVNGITCKLNIADQRATLANLSSQYPDAVVGILNKFNGVALYHLLQAQIPNIKQLETYYSEGIFLENIKKEGRLLFDFEYDEEHEIAINYGVEYLHNQSLRDFTDIDLTDLKEGDRLTNRWGNDPAFETEAETDAFKFVEKMEELRKKCRIFGVYRY